MKKVIFITASFLLFGFFVQAQTPTTTKKDWSKSDLTGRAADHFMIQFGSDSWQNAPDSVKTSGFSRHFNIYFMYDKPFKSNPRLSVAYGAGIGTSNIFFDDHTLVDIKSSASTLPFKHLGSTESHFEKSKVTTIYFQAPVELRYFTNPENPKKSFKYAVGLKLGTLLKAYTKSKNYVNSEGNSVYGKTFIEKRYSNRFFNPANVELTGRAGYGLFSLDMGYTITPVLRDGFGASFNKFSIGLTISGL
ncbi:MAG: outer membrane beta-barrel protein [Bacteroidetes bacterium]|nr:outer membrane beta-barrel protein [Bacteroidota bacterium]